MKTYLLRLSAILFAGALLFPPLISNAQSGSVSITPDASRMTSSSMGFPNPSGGAPCMPSHAASFRVALTAAGSCITNITVTRPESTVPAAPDYFSACVDGKSSRYTSDATDVSIPMSQCDPQASNDLVIAASGPGTMRIKVTTAHADGSAQTVSTLDVVIP